MATARRNSASPSDGAESHTADGNPNIFGDEFAESYAESVHAHSIHRSNSDSTLTGPALETAPYSPLRQSYSRPFAKGLQPAARGSTRTSGDIVSSDDHSDGTRLRQPIIQSGQAHSGAPLMTQRTTSSASSFSFATVGPQGGTGPSHPYGMYPQGLGVSRSGSVMTAATARVPSQNLTHRYGPAHPYGSYTQNLAAEGTDCVQQSLIPVGFPGSNQTYQRRVGPEGEEQDFIGLDGHTEQLPAYTRYPDDPVTKITTGLPLPAIGETDGPNAEDSLIEMQDRQPVYPNLDHIDSGREGGLSLETNTSSRSDKSWNEKSWKEKRRTKLCGCLPLWVLLLIIITVVIIAVVCGGVIGAFVANKQRSGAVIAATPGAQPAVVTTTVTQLIDASPLQTPAVLPVLPHGKHQLTLNPDESFDACLVDPKHKPAWSCALQGQTVNVTIAIQGGNYTASLNDFNSIQAFNYGTVPPIIGDQFLGYVSDDVQPGRGPAWHFQTLYDKIVIVADTALIPSTKVKREPQELEPELSRGQLTAGSQPWMCFFNQTFIEAFLYVYDNFTEINSTTTTTSYIPITSSTPFASSVPLITSVLLVPSIQHTSPTPLTSSTASPSSTTLIRIISSATPSASASAKTFSWAAGSFLPNFANGVSAALPSYGPNPYSSVNKLRVRATSLSSSLASASTNFPHVFKIKERRMPNSPPSYCQKMQQLQDGSWAPIVDTNGKFITISLSESDPALSTSPTTIPQTDDGWNANNCFCEWESS